MISGEGNNTERVPGSTQADICMYAPHLCILGIHLWGYWGDIIMLSKSDFIKEVFGIAREQGYKIEINARNNLDQIDFGHKKLHKGHLEELYPAILKSDANISKLIEEVAPGRGCVHKPMREILSKLLIT